MTEMYTRCGNDTVFHSAINATSNMFGFHAVGVHCGDAQLPKYVFPYRTGICANMKVQVQYSTSRVTCFGKYVVQTSVQPVYDQISGAKRRIDVKVFGVARGAHGIMGQNFHTPKDGRLDVYPSDGSAFVTKAQAEGAIDGTYLDYIVPTAYSHDFKFSRFQ